MKKDGAPTASASSSDVTADVADTSTEPGFLPGEMNRRSLLVRTGGAVAVAGAAAALGPVGGALAAPPAPKRVSASSSSPLPSAASVLADNRQLTDHEVIELAALLQAGEVSAVELAEAYYARINTFNGPFETYADNGLYGAFIRINEGIGLERGKGRRRKLAAARAGGERGPVPLRDPDGRQGLDRGRRLRRPGRHQRLPRQRRPRRRHLGRPPAGARRGAARDHRRLGLLGRDRRHLRRQRLEPRIHPRRFQPGLRRRLGGAARGLLPGGGDRRLDHLPELLQRRLLDQGLPGPGLGRRPDAALARLRHDRPDRPLRPRRLADPQRDDRRRARPVRRPADAGGPARLPDSSRSPRGSARNRSPG